MRTPHIKEWLYFFRSLSLQPLPYTLWKGRFHLHLTQFGSEFERYPRSHKINQMFHIITYYTIKVGSVRVLQKVNMEHIMFIRWGLMDITRYLIFPIFYEELTSFYFLSTFHNFAFSFIYASNVQLWTVHLLTYSPVSFFYNFVWKLFSIFIKSLAI